MATSGEAPFASLLLTPSSPAENRTQCFGRRLANIRWVRDLPREGLEHGVLERWVLIHTTERKERVVIQYPGAESVAKTPKPWDFRPKVELPDGSRIKDLGFGDIWDSLFVRLGQADGEPLVPAMAATLFYRMAYMKDHVRCTTIGNPAIGFVRNRATESASQGTGPQSFPPWLYAPPVEVVHALEGDATDWCGMSLEAFLHYNDILAWNEDSKYYYRDTRNEAEPWQGEPTGRVNTLLTHVNVIGLITRQTKLSNLLSGFSRQGVAPITKEASIRICAPYVVP